MTLATLDALFELIPLQGRLDPKWLFTVGLWRQMLDFDAFGCVEMGQYQWESAKEEARWQN